MFSEQSLCNCRTCGKRLTYDTMGAIFHYKWDDVGWAYCKDHIPSASINIDHIDLVGMTYNDGIPSLRVDVDAAMSDGTTIPFSAYLTDIPGIKDILEQIEGTVGKINSLTGHDWVYDPATDEIRVTADADIRNFTPSPIANTKLSKLLKDNTIPTAIRNNVKVTTLGMNGTETFNPTTKVMTVPVKADTNYPHTSSGKTAELAIDLSPYIPEPGDPAKVAYIQKNGTETFNPTTNQLSVPVKADTDQAATGTSLSVTIPVDLTQIIADAMKKVKVVSIAQNGTPTFDGATKKLNVPVKADTDHPDTGSAKTDTLGVDATPVLNAVKVASIEGNGDPTYNATTQKMTVPLKADTNLPTSTSEKTESIDVDISTPIADEQKKVKVDHISTNGTPSYDSDTKTVTVPLKADTDHPSTGTEKTESIDVDISQWAGGDAKVDYIQKNGDPTYNESTKVLTQPMKADVTDPSSGSSKIVNIEISLAPYIKERKVDPDTIKPRWNTTDTTYTTINGTNYAQLTSPSSASFIAKTATSAAYLATEPKKLTIAADTTDPIAGVTSDKAAPSIPVYIASAPKVDTLKGYGYGTQPSDTVHYDAMQRPQTNNYTYAPQDISKSFPTSYEQTVYNMARAGMCFKTDIEAELQSDWKYDLGTYGDTSTGLRAASKRSSWACNIVQSGHIKPGTKRPTVNVVDNNWWDGIWNSVKTAVGIAILLPDDPSNPHGVIINGEVYDEWKAQYRKGVQISFVAGNFFDPNIDLPSKFYAGEWEDIGNNAKCNIVLSNFFDPSDKSTILYPWSEAFIELPGENQWICPFLDTSLVWLDHGLYHYRTNGNQVSRLGNNVFCANDVVLNTELIVQRDTDLRVEGTTSRSTAAIHKGDEPGAYIGCYRFKLCGRRPNTDGSLTRRWIVSCDTFMELRAWNSTGSTLNFNPKTPPSWPAEWLQKVITY